MITFIQRLSLRRIRIYNLHSMFDDDDDEKFLSLNISLIVIIIYTHTNHYIFKLMNLNWNQCLTRHFNKSARKYSNYDKMLASFIKTVQRKSKKFIRRKKKNGWTIIT